MGSAILACTYLVGSAILSCIWLEPNTSLLLDWAAVYYFYMDPSDGPSLTSRNWQLCIRFSKCTIVTRERERGRSTICTATHKQWLEEKHLKQTHQYISYTFGICLLHTIFGHIFGIHLRQIWRTIESAMWYGGMGGRGGRGRWTYVTASPPPLQRDWSTRVRIISTRGN